MYEVENFTGKRVKCLQSDNGTEYFNNEFDDFLKKKGFFRRLTVSKTQQNAIAERKNRTHLETARCQLLQSKLSPSFWAESILTANYLRNRLPSKSNNYEIPYEKWRRKKLRIDHLLIPFGTIVLSLNKNNVGKFESRSKKCIFLGYSETSKAYRLWSIQERKLI